jgi:hypothetical protein
MNLHQIVAPIIAAINPPLSVGVRISAGSQTAADGTRQPIFDVPGFFMGSISGSTLTVVTVNSGRLAPGQLIADENGTLAAGTRITAFGTGTGGPGTYGVGGGQTVPLELMQTSLRLDAQVQPLSSRDLEQLEGLNLNGEKMAVYVNGEINGAVRVKLKGGDLLDFPDGSQWLVIQSLEGWYRTAGWSKSAIVLQN